MDFYAEEIGVGSISRDGLARGASDSFQITCFLPDGMPEGDYCISAELTCPDDDSDANNKGRDSSVIHVRVLPDLAVTLASAMAGTYRPGDSITVRSVIENVSERTSDTYTIRYYISVDDEITSRDYLLAQAECPGLAPAMQNAHVMICQLPSYIPAGACYVGAIISCPVDGRSRNNQASDDSPVQLIHPAGYLCGRMSYEDSAGWTHPIRYARVRIHKAVGSLPGQVLGETHTDGEGNYGFMLPAGGGTDIIVRVVAMGSSGACPGTTSAICTVKDDVLDELYALKSTPQPYPSTSSATVSLTSPRTAGEFMVYDSVVEGFLKTLAFFGAELDPITVYWPTSDNGTYYVPSKGIYIARYDRGDRDVILHEYGHYVADSHGFALGEVGLNPMHYWNTDLRFTPYYRSGEQAQNLAFREAWATLFSIAVQHGDSGYPNAGDARYQDYDEVSRRTLLLDLEADTYGPKSPGEYYENMNCCALWDIFDDNCDITDNRDTLYDPGLVRTWTICRDGLPKDIVDFWNGWFDRYDDAGEMVRNFSHHKIALRCPRSSALVETFESGDLAALSWSSSGDLPWGATAEVSHMGSYSARAGAIGNSQKSTLEVQATCDGGWISFWVKISSEMGCDKLQFYIDGQRKAEWFGQKDWQYVSYPVEPGERTFTWTYAKDESAADGADTAWLDDIELPVW